MKNLIIPIIVGCLVGLWLVGGITPIAHAVCDLIIEAQSTTNIVNVGRLV